MPETKVGVRLNPPYLHGAFFAMNAISDAYFLGDGPDCIRVKAEHIHGRHDLFSTLLSCKSDHRIQYTGVNVFNIASNQEGAIKSSLQSIAAMPRCGAVFMGSMPMCTIAGTDYERIMKEALVGLNKPAFLIPPRAGLSGDWLDGYSAVLEAMAGGMDLGGGRRCSENVAVVGHLMLRNEGDHKGNVRELERMLRALDLNPVSVWLSGGDYDGLREARNAGTVISMPHCRKAAAILAKRLKARLVEVNLPFGLAATKRFVETLGRAFGREKKAERFIRAELDDAIPRLEWIVPHAFLDRRFVFAGDPHFAEPFAEMIEELGGRIVGIIPMGDSRHLPADQRKSLAARPRTAMDPMQHEVERDWEGLAYEDADLLVTSTLALEIIRPKTSWVEFGCPSDYTHFIKDEPFFGFSGAVGFLGRLANEVSKGLCLRWLHKR